MPSLRRRRWEAHERQDNDDSQKRDAVDSEAHDHPQRHEHTTPDQRSDHLRQIELNGVECDRVGQGRPWHERRDHRLKRWTTERLCDPGQERQHQDVSDVDDVKEDQPSQCQGAAHLKSLRRDQEASPVIAVSDHAANQCEEQEWKLSDKRVESEKEGRPGQGEDQPLLRKPLHPRSHR